MWSVSHLTFVGQYVQGGFAVILSLEKVLLNYIQAIAERLRSHSGNAILNPLSPSYCTVLGVEDSSIGSRNNL